MKRQTYLIMLNFVMVCCLILVIPLIGEVKADQYRTEFRGANFIIYSSDESWTDQQFNEEYTAFNKAKAVITFDKDKIVLLAEKIILDRKTNRLLGENAQLILPDGTKKEKIKKISISLDQPLEYEIE